jgi:hypothetical protein
VPMTLFSSIIGPIPYLGCLSFLVALYALVLQVLAIEGVYRFGIGKAVLTLLVPAILACILVACLVAGVVAFLVPVFRETFPYIEPLPLP